MKKIISTLALSLGMLPMATSCSDFLEQTSPSEQTTETVYNSTYYTELRVNKIYGGLAQDRTYSQDFAIVMGLNTDCELIDALDANNVHATSNYRGVMNYNVDPGFTNLDKVWTAMYGVIEDANLTIEGIRQSPLLASGTNSEKSSMKRFLGEALTLRAMVYFDLVRTFGDVPLKLASTQSDLSNAYMAKTDRDVVLDTLMNNLDEAIEYLPWADKVTSYTTEHTTKGYAHGLLAQIAMTRAGYVIREKAKDGYETASYSDATYPTQRPGAAERKSLYERALSHLTAIINDGTHSLNPSFANEWYLINQLTLDQSYHENLFEIPMGENVTGELGYTAGVRLSGVTTKYGYGNSSGKIKLTAPLLYSYDKNDERRDITCSNIEIKNDANSVTREYMKGNNPFEIYVGKWDPREMSESWLNNNLKATAKHTTGINPVKMRYSQVLLYYAECLNELAGGPDANCTGDAGLTARQALKEVHCRAFDNNHKATAEEWVNKFTTQSDFFDALVQENAWEFAGESIRKYDLIRWNLLAQKITEFKNQYLQDLQEGKYQATLYFNYLDDAKTQIDMSSVTWYGIPEGKVAADYDDSVSSFGGAKIGTGSDKQVDTALPLISDGLVGESVTVKNRYLLPLGNSTIADSNGTLQNSYGW